MFAGSTVTTYVAVRPDPLIPGVHAVYEDLGALGLEKRPMFDDGD